ncbi:peptide chain release factor 2 [Facklamia hominis CCUG 36813]|uniref:Peptide chain release factor 2 n=1 Tax=Facklamia hominis CCUG 36813 TaxID=883111 RepID=K1LDP8_9LACT|nr:peptide chain release factor 2 [Facklamia hominis CCUG 36813]EPH07806.1 peptide chain release factor 2 [Facklamia hominis ACS-120-V-Sch10]
MDQMESDIAQCQDRMAQPGFWDDQSQAQSIIQEMNDKESTRNAFLKLVSDWEDLQVEVELYEETLDRPLWEEIEKNCYKFEQNLKAYQLSLLLSEEHDHCNAILEIHPGAGGKESQDWGQMLLRMYERWASQHDYHISVIDYQNGEEAGIKSVTLEVSGDKAYGFLKSEKGVHRLIRISPFDSNGKRHTSFCSIDVTPMIDDSIEIHINQDDLRIDTYRASGAGGQHINKTSSAVRITHIPTGIVTQSQAQRSQIQNREQAMGLLRAKLYQLELADKEAELQKIKGEQKEIAWGSQIRSYVFHPYRMVKDHRTNFESANVDAVMDGEIDPFIDAYLNWHLDQEN